MRTSRIVKSMSSTSSHWMRTVCVDFTETELFEYGYGMLNAHIAGEMIFLHRTFIFCIAKNNEKRKENKI